MPHGRCGSMRAQRSGVVQVGAFEACRLLLLRTWWWLLLGGTLLFNRCEHRRPNTCCDGCNAQGDSWRSNDRRLDHRGCLPVCGVPRAKMRMLDAISIMREVLVASAIQTPTTKPSKSVILTSSSFIHPASPGRCGTTPPRHPQPLHNLVQPCSRTAAHTHRARSTHQPSRSAHPRARMQPGPFRQRVCSRNTSSCDGLMHTGCC